MTATDELRRMLDERGVEWCDSSDENVLHTTWNDMNCWFNEFPDGRTAWGMAKRGTPEQAIAATVRRGECEIETTENWLPAERYHRCKHCGAFFAVMNASGDIQPCVCPNCGRKVKR